MIGIPAVGNRVIELQGSRGYIFWMDPNQREIFRRMTPLQKLNAAAHLRRTAWAWKAAYFNRIHPDWTEREIHEAVKKNFMYARS